MRRSGGPPAAIAALTLLAAGCGSASLPARTAPLPAPSRSASAPARVTPPGSPSPSASPPPVSLAATPGAAGCPPAMPAYAPPGVTLRACYRLSGEVAASGAFIDSYEGQGRPSCVSWAATGVAAIPSVGTSPASTAGSAPTQPAAPVLYLPDPGEAGVTVGREPLSFSFSIQPYTGPGTYTGIEGTETASYGTTIWNATSPAGFSAQVNADGSGDLTANLVDAGTGVAETVTELWTCVVEPKL